MNDGIESRNRKSSGPRKGPGRGVISERKKDRTHADPSTELKAGGGAIKGAPGKKEK